MKKQIVSVIMLMLCASMFYGKVVTANSPGPAPNSGDGISDGSGFGSTTSIIELVIVLVILLVGLLLVFFLFRRRKMRASTIRNKESQVLVTKVEATSPTMQSLFFKD